MTAVSDDNWFNNLSTAVLVLDASLHIRDANLAAQSLFAQSLKQLEGQHLATYWVESSLDWQRLPLTLAQRSSFSDAEVQVSFADGRDTLMDVAVSSYVNGSQQGVLLELRQVVHQKRINQENQQWSQLQSAKDLIRDLAHEIKNPLGGIRGAAQLLERQLDDPAHAEFTQMIIEQSDRLRSLVDRLLGPNQVPQFRWHNLHRVLEKVRTLLSVDAIGAVQLERDYDPSIPEVWLDADKFQQAVINIARNAIQALEGHGKVRFTTRIERQVIIHGQRFPLVALVKISDDGPGIPEQLRDTLFYPLVTDKKDGSGLGLSIAQTLIEHHRGKIEVDSRPGHTEFTLYLPIDREEPA